MTSITNLELIKKHLVEIIQLFEGTTVNPSEYWLRKYVKDADALAMECLEQASLDRESDLDKPSW